MKTPPNIYADIYTMPRMGDELRWRIFIGEPGRVEEEIETYAELSGCAQAEIGDDEEAFARAVAKAITFRVECALLALIKPEP